MMKNVLGPILLLAAVAAADPYLGRLDTIGVTTYDWQNGWSAVKCLVNAPEHGLHATWIWALETSGTGFPDRNMGYNYYDFVTRRWNWPDSEGANVFQDRAGYGNVDYDPATGAAIIGSHHSGTGGLSVELARDVEPGVGIFEYADGEGVMGYSQWPRIATGQNSTIHIIAMTAAYAMGYSRILPGNWPVFEPSIPLEPTPGFPCFNMAASKVSGKVALIWNNSASTPSEGYLQTSMDNGETWPWLVVFPPPDAYGGDTLTSFHITSLYPYYDWEDRLHVVTNVSPVVNDTEYIMPSQIWHWCADNSPEWSRIHVAGCDPAHLQAPVGYNATYADRPSIGEAGDGRLYVTWEQFDSSNVEILTNRVRAGIWAASSPDNGRSWSPGVLLTERNTFSHRFPSVVDRMVPGGSSGDTICVLYMIDSISGFYVQGEGPATLNPVVCQFVAAPEVGVQESPKPQASGRKLQASVIRGVLFLPSPYPLPAGEGEGVRGSVLADISGRKAMALRPGANDVSGLAPGVYFVHEGPGARGLGVGRMRKIILQR